MAEEIFTSKYDGTTQDNLLEFAENVKKSTTVDGAETINVQGFTLPRISDISGFVAVNNAGNAIGFMSKEQVASVLGELIGTATKDKSGLMSKDGFLSNIGLEAPDDLNEANNGVFKILSIDGKDNYPSMPQGYGILMAFSVDGWIRAQLVIGGDGPFAYYRYHFNNWSRWKEIS